MYRGLVAYFSSAVADRLYRSTSPNGGQSWETPVATHIPSNGAPVSLFRLINGHLVLMFNNNVGEGNRWPLSIALSQVGPNT